MASLSEPTKKTASSLTNKVSKVMDKIVGGRTTPVESEKSPAKLLGSIYELMVKMDEDKRLHEELQQTYDKEDAAADNHRHEELIKALTGRKKKPEIEKKVEKKKEEVEKVKKQPEAKAPEAKAEVKAPEAKAPEIKAKAPEAKVEAKAPEVKPTAEPVKPTVEPVKPAPTPQPTVTPPKPPTAAPAPPAPPTPPISSATKAGLGIGAIAAVGYESVKSMIKQHEGAIPYPYKDTKGLWTIGVGHLIGDGKSLPAEYDDWKNNGGPYDKKNNKTPALTNTEMENLFQKDFDAHLKIAKQGPGFELANETGQGAFIDLTYNMGRWWTIFKNAAKAAEKGDFKTVAKELTDSKWYTQVGKRAEEIVSLIGNGYKKEDKKVVPIVPEPIKGEQINQKSIENKDLKQSMDKPAIQNINNTMVNSPSSTTIQPTASTDDDRPTILSKR